MIELRLLGTVDVTEAGGGSRHDLLRLPKRVAVLAYLASPVPGTWHRRDALVGVFWPEHDQVRARNALRNAIYVLRQHLGDAAILSRGDEEVAVNPAVVRTDLAEVRAALTRGDAVAALAGYGGELLPGLHALGAPGFEHWLDAERERLQGMVTEAGRACASDLAKRGDIDAAIRVMRRVVEIAPQDERAVRALIEWHGTRGDRGAGLRVFEDYRTFLKREFETTPSGETLAAAARLRTPVTVGHDQSSPTVQTDLRETDPEDDKPDAPTNRRRWYRHVAVGITGLATLVALRGISDAPPEVPAIGMSTPVTSDPGLQVGPAISPSGRLVAYTAGTMLDLRVRVTRLDGGDPWMLTEGEVGFELMPRWAPDDDAIVFLGGNHAYIAPAVGGIARRIAAGGEGEAAVRSASWSPRGDSVAIVRRDSLLVLPRDGPGYRFVGRGQQLHGCTWSPDDRWIACVSGNWVANTPGPLFGNRANSAIVVFPVAGGDAVDVTGHDHQHTSPVWVADHSQLWLLSDRLGGQLEAFVARISPRGTLVGELQRVGLEAEFISVAGDRVAYAVASRRANVHSLPAFPDSIQSSLSARAETRGNQIVEVVRVSPDGRWLLYDSNAQGNSDIYRQAIDGGRPERLTDDPREEFAPDLSPDGGTLAYHLWEGSTRRVKLRRMGDGVITEPFAMPGDQGVPRWSPDGRFLAFWEHGFEPGAVALLRDDGAGTWHRVWRLDSTQLPAWRPDGQALGVLRSEGAVWLIPADSGAVRVLHQPSVDSASAIVTFLAWDPHRPLLWMLGHDRRNRNAIWVMPASGGMPRHVVDLSAQPGVENGPSLATDGSRLYFTLEERLSNVRWASLQPR